MDLALAGVLLVVGIVFVLYRWPVPEEYRAPADGMASEAGGCNDEHEVARSTTAARVIRFRRSA